MRNFPIMSIASQAFLPNRSHKQCGRIFVHRRDTKTNTFAQLLYQNIIYSICRPDRPRSGIYCGFIQFSQPENLCGCPRFLHTFIFLSRFFLWHFLARLISQQFRHKLCPLRCIVRSSVAYEIDLADVLIYFGCSVVRVYSFCSG